MSDTPTKPLIVYVATGPDGALGAYADGNLWKAIERLERAALSFRATIDADCRSRFVAALEDNGACYWSECVGAHSNLRFSISRFLVE